MTVFDSFELLLCIIVVSSYALSEKSDECDKLIKPIWLNLIKYKSKNLHYFYSNISKICDKNFLTICVSIERVK